MKTNQILILAIAACVAIYLIGKAVENEAKYRYRVCDKCGHYASPLIDRIYH
jgi:hypothetical protein